MITQQNATYLLYIVCICVVDRQVRTLLKIVRSNTFKVSPMQKCKFQVILSNFDLRTAYPYPLPLLRNVCMQMDTSFIRNPWSMSSKYHQTSVPFLFIRTNSLQIVIFLFESNSFPWKQQWPKWLLNVAHKWSDHKNFFTNCFFFHFS